MQDNNPAPPENDNNSMSTQKKICFFLCIYLFLIMSTRYSTDSTIDKNSFLIAKLSQPNTKILLTDILGAFNYDQMYEGSWRKINTNVPEELFLSEPEGTFRIYVDRQTIYSVSFAQTFVQHVQLQILNGDYIDKGALYYSLYLDNNDFETDKESNKKVNLFINSSKIDEGYPVNYREQNIFSTNSDGLVNLTYLNMTAEVLPNDKINIYLTVGAEGYQLDLNVTGLENKFVANLIFVGLMIFCSFMSFSSIMNILRSIIELQDNPRKYSFVTVMLTNMWDTVLCILCFILAFKDQLSLMFFIVPAFLYCLMFTNLQPRFLMIIFQSNMDNDANFRMAICKFNLLHYGSLFAIYPLLIFTNFNWVFFIGISCIVFPQIYANGFNNARPDISSPYYTKYLFSRFIIILYLKCFPGNIFLLKPDYVLGFVCLMLISIQYGLLVIQKMYGSKKVLPSFLLEPVYDYFLHQEYNIQEGVEAAECSICLTPLNQEPPKNAGQLEFEPNGRLMKTPCNHSYHSHCLLAWMKIKMQCPQCRYKLPPYE